MGLQQFQTSQVSLEPYEVSPSLLDIEIPIPSAAVGKLSFSRSSKRKTLKEIAREIRANLSTARFLADDMRRRHAEKFNTALTKSNEKQTASLKRLTLVASVFLPLTLGATVLAMTTRPSGLGILWYNYFGICLTLGFVVLVLYQGSRFAQDAWKGTAGSEYTRLWASGVRPVVHNIQKGHGLFFRMTTLYLLALGAVVVTSFLAGMFQDLESSLDVLKYGVGAWGGLIILACLAWIAVRLLKSLRDT